ncbi:targeting protein for Xklp2 isoform X1 [Scleropages formosus]|uniref:targeting protein for Xklp2 isoform X1 n=1 Tax=Scleropages formosus TaxID=113540 RepID=UPI000879195A|nr:targeting protein for Xklp2 isoform X1 [Scleropages formosus]
MDVQNTELPDKYEFDAPSHVVDVRSLDLEDRADQWFDEKVAETRNKQAEKPRAVVSPRRNTDRASAEPAADKQNRDSSAVPSNIVTSWGDSKQSAAKLPQRKGPPAQPRRLSKRREMAVHEERRKRASAATASTPPNKKQRRSVRALPLRSAFHQRRNVSQKNMEEQESTEVLDQEMTKPLKGSTSVKTAIAGSQPVKKAVLSITVPMDFQFRTDDRLRAADCAGDGAHGPVDFAAQLRKRRSSPGKARGPRRATVPKPFNLSAGTKRKFEDTSPYVPMAQQVELFQKRTPARYHLHSRQRDERGPSPVKNDALKITNPQTPQLMTRQRGRPVTVKSTAEIEAEELEKIQQFKFKAAELNRKILEGAMVPKKPPPREPTQPEGFQLEIERRLQERQATRKPEEAEDHTFRSRPLPTRILEDVVGVPEKKVQNPTVPESPAFALKNRVKMERKVEEVKAAPPVRANPAPHFGLPFQPKLPEMRHVEMCPFSFEARERERQALKEKRLEQMRNEEVPKFKAQPLPDFHEVHLPEKKVIEPTKVEPFRLLADERGAAKSERWEQMMKEELRQQVEAANFKARPNMVTSKEPFVPKKENRSVLEAVSHPTVPEGFQLSTERRAKERQEFERSLCEREAQRARMEEQERREWEEKEKEEIARLRQEQVHKAQPIRRYKQMELKKSEVSLTVPQSPNFSNRFRM